MKFPESSLPHLIEDHACNPVGFRTGKYTPLPRAAVLAHCRSGSSMAEAELHTSFRRGFCVSVRVHGIQ